MSFEFVATLPIIIIILIILALVFLFTFVPVTLWISALAAGVKVGLFPRDGVHQSFESSRHASFCLRLCRLHFGSATLQQASKSGCLRLSGCVCAASSRPASSIR